MKYLSISALLSVLLLVACSEPAPEAPAEPAPAATAPAPEPAPPPAPKAGGYEPTAEERIPGATVPQEEIDKKMAELLKDTPKPIIPGEAPAADPAPEAEAPAAEAPTETETK